MALSILLVRALVEGVEHAGVRREDFLQSAAVDGRRLDDGDARVSLGEYEHLVETALSATGDEAFGLHMGERATVTTYNLLAHLVSHAATLRGAIDALTRYHRLLTDRWVCHLSESDDAATLRYEPLAVGETVRRFGEELTLTGFARMVQYFGRGEPPMRVCFTHPAPSYVSEYRRLFGGAERFEQAEGAVVFDRAVLDRDQLNADAEFHSVLEGEAARRLMRLDQDSHRARLLKHLLERTIGERTDMDAASRALGLSSRTLRRHLAEERTSYAAVLEEALATQAKELLRKRETSIEEVAYALGFSERSAFHRAFKRWTGTTPSEFRGKKTSAR